MTGDRFRFDPALDAALARDPVPELPAGFADRIMAATQDRAPPLPPTPPARKRPAPAARWRSARRLAVGTAAFGALAGAAAASGVLGDLPIALPSADAMWEAITGEGDAPPALAPASNPAPKPAASPAPPQTIREILDQPIRNAAELEETYRKIDGLRQERSGQRRERVDALIEETLERRRVQGLPAPTVEQERQIRQRIDGLRQRGEAARERNMTERRSQQRERIEQGETLTGEDLIEDVLQDAGKNAPPAMRDRLDRVRALPPEQRQERLRGLRDHLLDRSASPAQPLPTPEPSVQGTENGSETQADEPPSTTR